MLSGFRTACPTIHYDPFMVQLQYYSYYNSRSTGLLQVLLVMKFLRKRFRNARQLLNRYSIDRLIWSIRFDK